MKCPQVQVNLLLQEFLNGPNKENSICRHGIKFPLFFHLILGQREQDPPGAFIIVLKRKRRRDLNLNPENPSQERAAEVGIQAMEKEGRLVSRQWCFIPPSTTVGLHLTKPSPLGLVLLSFLPNTLVLLPLIFSLLTHPNILFYLTRLFCLSSVSTTNITFECEHNRKTGNAWL